jgi:hypothetical protein
MRERNPYRRNLRLEEGLAGALTVVFATITAGNGIKAGLDIAQGASSAGEYLVGGAIVTGMVAAGFGARRQHARQLRLEHANYENLQRKRNP